MKKFIFLAILALSSIVLTAAGPPATTPTVDIEFVDAPTGVITIAPGETYTATFTVESDTQWLTASAIPDPQFPGRIVDSARRDQAGAGSSAELTITWTGNTNTTNTAGEPVPVGIFVAVRYPGGIVVVEEYTVYFQLEQ